MMSCAELLERWHRGDGGALELLLQLVLPAVHEHVHRRLGAQMRRKLETGDCVQEALVEFLRCAPRFVISDEAQLKALLQRIAENVIRDGNDWFTARRRSLSRERPLPTDTVLSLDPPQHNAATPSQVAVRNEQEAWVRFALELVSPEERNLIALRLWDDLSFEEIAGRLGIAADAARMRFNRAVRRLSDRVATLRRGELDAALAQADEP